MVKKSSYLLRKALAKKKLFKRKSTEFKKLWNSIGPEKDELVYKLFYSSNKPGLNKVVKKSYYDHFMLKARTLNPPKYKKRKIRGETHYIRRKNYSLTRNEIKHLAGFREHILKQGMGYKARVSDMKRFLNYLDNAKKKGVSVG